MGLDLDLIFAPIFAKFPVGVMVLAILGMLVVGYEAYVILTPSKADDDRWERIKAKSFLGPLLAYIASKSPVGKK